MGAWGKGAAMHDMAVIFRDEVRRLGMNVVSVVIALGLVVMPSIFAWYNIIACWNVFDNTGNLTVAVANDDEGYESDLVPLRVNVGEQVVSALRANSQIDWVFTDGDDAVDGARSGRYYAAVVIPKEFSRDMLTFYSDDSQHARIIYYSNEKVSAIAPKITDRGADTVSYEVNQVFAQTLSEVSLALAEAVARYADDADVGGRIASVAGHLSDVAAEVRQAADVLGVYGGLTDAAAGLIGSADAFADSTGQQVDALKGAASSGAGSLEPLAQGLADTLSRISDALAGGAGSYDDVAAAADAAFSDASATAQESAAQMRNTADGLSARITSYQRIADQLDAAAGLVDPSYEAAVRAAAQTLRFQAQTLTQVQQSLRASADRLEEGDANLQEERAKVKEQLAQAQAAADGLKASFDEMRPGLQQIADEAGSLAQNVMASLDALGGVSGLLDSASGHAVSALQASTGKLAEVGEELRGVADGMDALAADVNAALASGNQEDIRAILTTDVSTFSSALAAPIGMERVAVYPADNFGSQMAPLYTTLALFIGSLLILVVMKPVPCRRTLALVLDAKPRQVFLGHFGVMALISFAQTTLTALGNLFFLHVQVAHPWLYLLVFWLAGWVFTFMIYALVVSFANLGKAIAVLLLIIQVTGCGGSFPLQILPPFVQALSPYLPATYVVNAMREAMMGTYGNVYWEQLGGLLLFLVPAALLGLALRKPLERFMHWYLAQVEKSDLMA